MAKTVAFGAQPRKPDPAELDAFVNGDKKPEPKVETVAETSAPLPAAIAVESEPLPTVPKVPMKRLTFDIAAATHMRMKIDCVTRNKDMAEELREMIEARWPVGP